jgi:hypothetical protein
LALLGPNQLAVRGKYVHYEDYFTYKAIKGQNVVVISWHVGDKSCRSAQNGSFDISKIPHRPCALQIIPKARCY